MRTEAQFRMRSWPFVIIWRREKGEGGRGGRKGGKSWWVYARKKGERGTRERGRTRCLFFVDESDLSETQSKNTSVISLLEA